jgi:arsenate reductase
VKEKVLFICTHNSARSQMAEGLMNHLMGDRYEASSAGTETRVNPFAVEAMGELGIDISHHRSKTVEEFRETVFDCVVTVCDSAKESCPFFPGKRVLHTNFEDPSRARGSREEILKKFTEVRDRIRRWMEQEFGK